MPNIAKQTSAAVRAMGGPPPLSISLTTALETPLVPVVGDDGFDMRPGSWKPPAVVSAVMVSEAGQHIAFMDAVQFATAETSTVKAWLIALGNAVASSSALTADDVQAKVSALLTLLEDYPAGVFTKATLKRAATRFTFFPAFAELAKVLDDEAAALRLKRGRLEKIASGGGGAPAAPADDAPSGPRTLSDEVQSMLARVKANLSSATPLTRPEPRRQEAAE
jgi:hypothetical protein